MLPFPNNLKINSAALSRSLLPRRRNKVVLVAILSLCLFTILVLHRRFQLASSTPFGLVVQDASSEPDPEFPPLYEEYYKFERHLPQHNLSLPHPEGANGRYFYPADHVWGLGWNNILQEQILLSHLAYVANRSFVFDPYTWDVGDNPYSEYNGRLIPSRIPMNAIISGPTSGGSFDKDDHSPRAVTHEFFDEACPYHERATISEEEANELHNLLQEAPGDVILKRWVDRINSVHDGCVEVHMFAKQIFDFYLFGSDRVLSLWPSLSKSPILTRFAWSPLVMAGVKANSKSFTPSTSIFQRLLSYFRVKSQDPYALLPGLLAIHVRRGDYNKHCDSLALWGSTFHGWAQLPFIPDRFAPSPDSPEHHETVMRHCWPTIEQMVQKVRSVMHSDAGRGLKRVFIMTNGDRQWVEELKAALYGVHDWEMVASSRELSLNFQQRYIAQAIDMVIAQKSQVFIGNGFSSLTANVILLRASKNLIPDINRLW